MYMHEARARVHTHTQVEETCVLTEKPPIVCSVIRFNFQSGGWIQDPNVDSDNNGSDLYESFKIFILKIPFKDGTRLLLKKKKDFLLFSD